VCIHLLTKYETEQKKLTETVVDAYTTDKPREIHIYYNTHVLDSQKHEEMMCTDELFTMPTIPQHHSYPVVVASSTNGFMLNSGEFVVMINC
jgi:hypothetical protein